MVSRLMNKQPCEKLAHCIIDACGSEILGNSTGMISMKDHRGYMYGFQRILNISLKLTLINMLSR